MKGDDSRAQANTAALVKCSENLQWPFQTPPHPNSVMRSWLRRIFGQHSRDGTICQNLSPAWFIMEKVMVSLAGMSWAASEKSVDSLEAAFRNGTLFWWRLFVSYRCSLVDFMKNSDGLSYVEGDSTGPCEDKRACWWMFLSISGGRPS